MSIATCSRFLTLFFFFFSSRRRHTRLQGDWSSDVCSSDLSGDLDINYFQHQPFLDNAIQKNGYKLASAGTGILANVGLYSLKHKSIAQVPQGGKVGIANDPVNQGRGLLLLQKVGLRSEEHTSELQSPCNL